jgi:RNA polymerase sigma-70 factor (ECF subfamily)
MTQPQSAADGRGESPRSARIDWRTALVEHDRWLRTVVLARLGERQAVDEVMQEIALAAVAQKAPIDDPTKVAPWLYRLAVLQTLLYRRKTGRGRKLVDRYAERVRPSVADDVGDPLAWLLADEQRRLVRDALAKLPPRDAEILLLKYSENWSYREIAARLGIGESAVEARLHRARAKLRASLQGTSVEVTT